MAIQIIFQWQNTDSTSALNQRLASLIEKGVYYGGDIVPVGAGSLNATRQPFFAVGRDGITIVDTDTYTVAYQPSLTQYHCVLAKYNPLGTPSTPTIEELVLTETEYNNHAEKSYLIVLAVVTPSASEVTYSHIDYSSRDDVGPFGHKWFKGVVENETDLPTGTPNFNKAGDTYVVQNDPPLYGWGVYTWTGSLWRLIAANGASTLDGAYDDNGASPGAGRQIYVDAQAVELTQSTTSQRSEDLANAALRIDKTGSTTFGDGALDIKTAQDYDIASIMVRSLYADGTNIQVDETVNITAPNVLTGTRGGAAWNASPYQNYTLVEVSGSSLGSDGLYLVGSITGANTCTLLRLDGAAITLPAESGLIANFFTARFTMGAMRDNAHVLRSIFGPTTGIGSVENYGNSGNGTDIGKVILCHEDKIGSVWEVWTTLSGDTTPTGPVARLKKYGNLEIDIPAGVAQIAGIFYSPLRTGIDVRTDAPTLYAAVYGETSGNGAGVSGRSINGYGVQGKGLNAGVYGEPLGGSAVGCYGYTAAQTYSYGISGEAVDDTSVGVVGVHDADGNAIEAVASGTGYGLYSQSVAGTAIRGEAYGTNVNAVEGQKATSGGYAGYFEHGGADSLAVGVLGTAPASTSGGAGVRGLALGGAGGVGVEADQFAYWSTDANDVTYAVYRLPITSVIPENAANWRLQRSSYSMAWELQASSGLLHWQWADYPDGCKIIGISFEVYIHGATTAAFVVQKRNIQVTKDATAQAYELNAEVTATSLLNYTQVYGGSGYYNSTYGPSGVPAFVAANLTHGTTYNSALPNLDPEPLQGTILLNLANSELHNIYFTLKLRGATRWEGPTVP